MARRSFVGKRIGSTYYIHRDAGDLLQAGDRPGPTAGRGVISWERGDPRTTAHPTAPILLTSYHNGGRAYSNLQNTRLPTPIWPGTNDSAEKGRAAKEWIQSHDRLRAIMQHGLIARLDFCIVFRSSKSVFFNLISSSDFVALIRAQPFGLDLGIAAIITALPRNYCYKVLLN